MDGSTEIPDPSDSNYIGNHEVAILIPCYNEEAAVAKVIKDFQVAVPTAVIYVYDNNSSDNTVAVARLAGALVYHENQQGKGHVIRRMFSDVEADIYLIVDGDDTYEAEAAPKLINKLLTDSLDMVNGKRVDQIADAYRLGHKFGNWMLTTLVTFFFGERTQDILSGYRVFSRRFAKSFPSLSMGFEIETELTIHALELCMPIEDVDISYKKRPEGSESKLNTIADGVRIFKTIALLIRQEKPLQFFTMMALILALLSIGIAYPIIMDYLDTGLVVRFPTATLSASIMILSFLSFFCGVILDTVSHGRKEFKRLAYLQYSAVSRK